MYSTKLEELSKAIKRKKGTFVDKSVPSVRSVVTNIQPDMNRKMDVEEFMQEIFSSVCAQFSGEQYVLTAEEFGRVAQIEQEKYQTWKWNFAYAPRSYIFQTTLFLWGGRSTDVELRAERSIIISMECLEKEDFAPEEQMVLLQVEKLLIGVFHERSAMQEALAECTILDETTRTNIVEMLL